MSSMSSNSSSVGQREDEEDEVMFWSFEWNRTARPKTNNAELFAFAGMHHILSLIHI